MMPKFSFFPSSPTLYEAALALSDVLHELEEKGYEVPPKLDDAWADLTAAIIEYDATR